jgi:hypothetical protein
MVKNKTLAAWLALLGGALGLHRMYLRGWTDWLAWIFPVPTALGLYGIKRIQMYGVDDQLSWALVPLIGFTLAVCALQAILIGLTPAERWNEKFNPLGRADSPAGNTSWLTIGAVVASLFIGTTLLMASLAFSFQRYFEYQIEAARQISQ